MKKHNFNAGPCVLPREAVESAIEAIRDFDNTGIGLLEISHRTPGWERIMAETEQMWRDLLNIPDDYAVMFLGGGASTQFFEVPANLLKKKAAYPQTGVWAKKAAKEAKYSSECFLKRRAACDLPVCGGFWSPACNIRHARGKRSTLLLKV